MLKLLFNEKFWIILAIVALVITLIVVYAKFPKSKKAIIAVLAVLALVATINSVYQLHVYYTAESEIYGQYSSSDEDNKVEVNSLTFNFKNTELTATGNESEYSATFTSEEIFSLKEDSNYLVYVNSMPCDYIEISPVGDYIIATYQYNFYNENRELTCNDTLTFHFACYNNYSTFSVKTTGGAEAVKHWNSYFNKNSFVVKVEETTNIYSPDISFGEGEVTYVTATYTIDGEHYMTQVYQPNTVVTFPEFNNELYAYWSTDGESRILTDYTITEDTNFVAMYHTNAEFCSMAYEDMVLGVLDLSQYPITTIPSQMFSEHTAIKEVKLPSTLITIGSGAFQYTSLTSVTIPEGVLNINNYAFNGTPITSVSLPESLVNIGWGAFANCTNLTQIELKANVQSIGTNVGGLEIYIVEGSIEDGTATTRIMTEAFYGCDLTINCLFAEGIKSFSEDWNYNGEKYLEVTYFGQPGTGENTDEENQNQGTNKDPITDGSEGDLGDE